MNTNSTETHRKIWCVYFFDLNKMPRFYDSIGAMYEGFSDEERENVVTMRQFRHEVAPAMTTGELPYHEERDFRIHRSGWIREAPKPKKKAIV